MHPPDPISSSALCNLMALDAAKWPQCKPGLGTDVWLKVGTWLLPVAALPPDQDSFAYLALIGTDPIEQNVIGPTSNEFIDIFYEDEVALQKDKGRALNLVALRAASYLIAQKIDEIATAAGVSWVATYHALLKHGFRPVDGWMAAIAMPLLYSQGPLSASASDVGIAWMVARNALATKANLATTDMVEPPLFPGEASFMGDFAATGDAPSYPTPVAIFRQAAAGPLGSSSGQVSVRVYRNDAIWNSTDQTPYDFGGLVARAFTTLFSAATALATSVGGPAAWGFDPKPGSGKGSSGKTWVQIHPVLDFGAGGGLAIDPSLVVEGGDLGAAAASALDAADADPTNIDKARDAALAAAKAAAADPTNKAKADAAKKAAAKAAALKAAAGDGSPPAGMGTGAKVGIVAAVAAAGWVGIRVATKKPVWPF